MSSSKNATFLFNRDFMDYHKDRFEDNSYVIFKNDELFALFPANKVNETLFSHQGLSYGGLLLLKEVKFEEVFQAFDQLLKQMALDGFLELTVKEIPRIYHNFPSDELDYLFFKLDAQIVRRDIASVIETANRLNLNSSNRKRGLKRAKKNNLVVKESTDFMGFWNNVLIPNLKEQHNANPVHSAKEIEMLHKKFPNNIRQFNVYNENKIVAGVTIFESENVAHAQYISGNENKQELGSLDLVFDYLINTVYCLKKYFDFGISNENDGQQINHGLLSWKESFGARSSSINFYTINLENRNKLNNTFL